MYLWGQLGDHKWEPDFPDERAPPSEAELAETCELYLFEFQRKAAQYRREEHVVARVYWGPEQYKEHPEEHIGIRIHRRVDEALNALCRLASIPYTNPTDAPLLKNEDGNLVKSSQQLEDLFPADPYSGRRPETAYLYAYIL